MVLPQEATRPLHITQRGTTLEVGWADGHASELPLARLRNACVCANCRQEAEEHKADPLRITQAPSTRSTQLEQVGNYALGITWSDGHTSIFSFEALRELDAPQ